MKTSATLLMLIFPGVCVGQTNPVESTVKGDTRMK